MPFWLNATGTPGKIAARAGNCVRVLPHAYTHRTGGREALIDQHIEDTLDPDSSTSPYRGLPTESFQIFIRIMLSGRVGLEPTTGGL